MERRQTNKMHIYGLRGNIDSAMRSRGLNRSETARKLATLVPAGIGTGVVASVIITNLKSPLRSLKTQTHHKPLTPQHVPQTQKR